MDLLKASFKEIADNVQSKKISAFEVTKFFFERAQKLDSKLNSFISFNDKALDEATALDVRISNG